MEPEARRRRVTRGAGGLPVGIEQRAKGLSWFRGRDVLRQRKARRLT